MSLPTYPYSDNDLRFISNTKFLETIYNVTVYYLLGSMFKIIPRVILFEIPVESNGTENVVGSITVTNHYLMIDWSCSFGIEIDLMVISSLFSNWCGIGEWIIVGFPAVNV